MTWKVIRASVIGTSHIENGSPCQDECYADLAGAFDGTEFLVCLVADGAGSAKESARGSELACVTARRSIEASLASAGPPPVSDAVVVEWIKDVRREIYSIAEQENLASRDFACTLVGAVIGPKQSVFFQIGDGSIVVKKSDIAGVVFWPDSGPYANMTYFVTDEDALDHLQVAITGSRFDEVAMFSDGIQRIALSFEGKTPHWPFFEPMFRILRAKHPDECQLLDNELARFLGSTQVNERTDDDKTLILATCLTNE